MNHINWRGRADLSDALPGGGDESLGIKEAAHPHGEGLQRGGAVVTHAPRHAHLPHRRIYLSYIYLGYFVCLCVIVCVCVSQLAIAERSAILLVLEIKLIKETRRRVRRGRDWDGEIGKGQIGEGGCDETLLCLILNWEACTFTVPPAVALLNYISSGILWWIFPQTGIFAGFSHYSTFAVYLCTFAQCMFNLHACNITNSLNIRREE